MVATDGIDLKSEAQKVENLHIKPTSNCCCFAIYEGSEYIGNWCKTTLQVETLASCIGLVQSEAELKERLTKRKVLDYVYELADKSK